MDRAIKINVLKKAKLINLLRDVNDAILAVVQKNNG